MEKLHITIFLLLGVATFIGAMGLIGAQNNSDKIDNIEIPEEGFDWKTDTEFWKFINDNYISENELSNFNQTIISKNQDQDNKIAVVEARTTDIKTTQTETPIDTPSNSLNLQTTSSDPSDFKFKFTRGDIVYITGKGDPSTHLKFQIIWDDNDEIILETSLNTGTDGTFTKVFITDDKTQTGIYTAKFTWKLNIDDFIKFEII